MPSRAAYCHVAPARLPIIQNTADRNDSTSAKVRNSRIAALPNAPTITPASSSVCGSSTRPGAVATRNTSSTAEMAPTNAAVGITQAPSWSRCSTTAATDPVAAPLDTPRMNGSASGFRSSAWNVMPESANAAPHSAASTTRGARRPRTMARVRSSPSPSSARTMSPVERPTAPIRIAISTAAIRSSASSAMRGRTAGSRAVTLRTPRGGSRPAAAPRPGRCSGRDDSPDRRPPAPRSHA